MNEAVPDGVPESDPVSDDEVVAVGVPEGLWVCGAEFVAGWESVSVAVMDGVWVLSTELDIV